MGGARGDVPPYKSHFLLKRSWEGGGILFPSTLIKSCSKFTDRKYSLGESFFNVLGCRAQFAVHLQESGEFKLEYMQYKDPVALPDKFSVCFR